MNRIRLAAIAALWLSGCAGALGPAVDDNSGSGDAPSSVWLKSDGPLARPDSAGAHLDYYGGPVISNVQVHTVYWSSRVKFQSDLDGFYAAVTQSPYFDWLDEYATPTQHIGRGSFAGSYVDGAAPSGKTITNQQIIAELGRLIDHRKLPSPKADDLYMVHFPPGVTITMDDGSASCAQFCAYHYTFVHKGKNVYYGVMPDLGGACRAGCGGGSQLDDTMAASSHEMIEAVTDGAVGLANSLAPPLAWYDATNGEIGDICVGQTASVAGYTVQLEWSNANGACIATSDGGGGGGGGGAGGGGGGGGGGDCTEVEPNDDPTRANAMCSADTMSGTIASSGDVDWYEWTLPKKSRYTVTLSNLPDDYDMALYHASASGRLTHVETAADAHDRSPEQISHKSRTGGRYLLKVFGVGGATSSSPYQVSVAVQ
jgi:hypothetical protein